MVQKVAVSREFEARLRHAATGKLSVSTQQKMGTFFELGKDKAAKGEASAVPKIQWDSNPHCPYGYYAMGHLYLYLEHLGPWYILSGTPLLINFFKQSKNPGLTLTFSHLCFHVLLNERENVVIWTIIKNY